LKIFSLQPVETLLLAPGQAKYTTSLQGKSAIGTCIGQDGHLALFHTTHSFSLDRAANAECCSNFLVQVCFELNGRDGFGTSVSPGK
jgi:hypothetical protein